MPLDNQGGAPNPDPNAPKPSVSVEEYEALKAEHDQLKAQVARLSAEPEPEPAAGEPAPFNYDKWAKTFIEKPDEGMDQLDEHRFGFNPRKELPAMRAAVQELVNREQAREAREWMKDTPAYEKNEKNSEALLGVMGELNLPATHDGFSAGFQVAVSRGLIKPKGEQEKKEPPQRRGGMPAARPGASAAAPAGEPTLAQLENMTDEELLKVAEQGSIWQ